MLDDQALQEIGKYPRSSDRHRLIAGRLLFRIVENGLLKCREVLHQCAVFVQSAAGGGQ